MTSPDQLPLPLLPVRAARGREDFFVSSSNALALATLDDWHNWPGSKCLLVGPDGSGKTHLAHVWAQASGATLIEALDLEEDIIPDLAARAVCVENVDRITQAPDAQSALFHLHNLVLAQGNPFLVTGTGSPTDWAIDLPDLKSRLLAAQVARLSDPDDALLGALLAKLFSDRQIVPARDVIPYLLRHMPRSHAAAQSTVAELDAAALGSKGGVTRPLAVLVMSKLAQSD